MSAAPEAAFVEATNADREAAAAYVKLVGWSAADIAAIRAGDRDRMPSVQAFAQHRVASR